MTAINHIATARNDEFAARVMQISFKVAQNVASEDPGYPHHAERIAYAQRIIRGDDNPKNMAAHMISSNGSIQATIDANPNNYGSDVPDGDIEFALATIWDARALSFAAGV
jgi:hypothetical protein